jgi:hypothetical protein
VTVMTALRPAAASARALHWYPLKFSACSLVRQHRG